MESSYLKTEALSKLAIVAAHSPHFLEMAGIGIHSGKNFSVRFHFKKENESLNQEPIQFCYYKGESQFETPALWTRLSGTARSTALVLRGEQKERFELKTVEHLMAALWAAAFPRVMIEVIPESKDSDILELPILEGSALPWCTLLREVVLRHNTLLPLKSKKFWRPKESYCLRDGDREISVEAREDLKSSFACNVDFRGHWFEECHFEYDWMSPVESFKKFELEVSLARTFGFKDEIEKLQSKGLALGGSLDNALLLDQNCLINPGGFRCSQELARHKMLDAIGDFALAGAPILAHTRVVRAGHDMHLRCLTEMMRKGLLEEIYVEAPALYF